jgi:hypothetical protein
MTGVKLKAILSHDGKRLTLPDGEIYSVEILRPDPLIATKAVRLTKASGESYDVAAMIEGWANCDCGDWTYRTSNTAEGCRHTIACRQCGLI